MAAKVSSLARMLSGYVKEEGESGKREPVTRDFLGGGAAAVLGSPEVDLELKVPDGWVRRIDLTSGQTCLFRRDPEFRSIQDLNLTPPSSQFPRPAAADPCTNLDLKLSASAPRAAAAAGVPEYSSICTLEKVKFALERAEREARATTAICPPPLLFHPPRPDGGRLALSPSVSSTTTATTTSSMKRRSSEALAAAAAEAGEGSESSVGAVAPAPAEELEEKMAVVSCPGCLLYVLVSKEAPRCPRCAAHVPIKPRHQMMKKPKLALDLNSSADDDE